MPHRRHQAIPALHHDSVHRQPQLCRGRCLLHRTENKALGPETILDGRDKGRPDLPPTLVVRQAHARRSGRRPTCELHRPSHGLEPRLLEQLSPTFMTNARWDDPSTLDARVEWNTLANLIGLSREDSSLLEGPLYSRLGHRLLRNLTHIQVGATGDYTSWADYNSCRKFSRLSRKKHRSHPVRPLLTMSVLDRL